MLRCNDPIIATNLLLTTFSASLREPHLRSFSQKAKFGTFSRRKSGVIRLELRQQLRLCPQGSGFLESSNNKTEALKYKPFISSTISFPGTTNRR